MLSLLLVVLAQAPTAPPVWVVVTRRQGVAALAANQEAADVVAQLQAARVPAAPEPGDLTACKGKLACVVKEAKARPAQYVVVIELARILEQSIVKLDVISIEEDGRKLGSGVYDGPAAKLREGVAELVKTKVLPALAALVPPPAPVPPAPPPPEPAPVVSAVPIAPPPAPAPVAEAVAPRPPPTRTSPMRIAGFVAAGLGVAGLATAGALGVLTLQAVGTRDARCPPEQGQCNDPQALAAHDRAASTQEAGIVAAAAGGALLVAGVVLVVMGRPQSDTTVSISASPAGAQLTLGGRF